MAGIYFDQVSPKNQTIPSGSSQNNQSASSYAVESPENELSFQAGAAFPASGYDSQWMRLNVQHNLLDGEIKLGGRTQLLRDPDDINTDASAYASWLAYKSKSFTLSSSGEARVKFRSSNFQVVMGNVNFFSNLAEIVDILTSQTLAVGYGWSVPRYLGYAQVRSNPLKLAGALSRLFDPDLSFDNTPYSNLELVSDISVFPMTWDQHYRGTFTEQGRYGMLGRVGLAYHLPIQLSSNVIEIGVRELSPVMHQSFGPQPYNSQEPPLSSTPFLESFIPEGHSDPLVSFPFGINRINEINFWAKFKPGAATDEVHKPNWLETCWENSEIVLTTNFLFNDDLRNFSTNLTLKIYW